MVAINFLNIHTVVSWGDALGFFIHLGELFFNFIVLKYLSNKVIDWLGPRFDHWVQHNPIEVAIERHYRHMALNRNNHHDDPLICEDTDCRIVKI